MHSLASKCTHTARQTGAALAIVLLLPIVAIAAGDERPFQVEVNILSATVKAGATPIAALPRGTKLRVHQFNGDYYLVDLPGANPPQQGWIAKDDVHRVVNEFAELLRRIGELPINEREAAKERAIADFENLVNSEKKMVGLTRQRKFAEAVQLARQIARGVKGLLGDDNIDYAEAINNLGLSERDVGNFTAAQQDLSAALAIYREVYGPTHSDVAMVLNNLGDVAYHADDYPAAKLYHTQALAIRRAVFGEKSGEVAHSLHNLGVLADAAGDYALARSLDEQALAIKRKAFGDKDPSTASTLHNLAMIAMETGDFPTAISRFNEALEIEYNSLGVAHPDTAATLNNMGRLAERMGDYAAAAKYFNIALSAQRQLFGEKNPHVAHALQNLGVVAERAGDYATARKDFEQALAIRRESLGEQHADTAASLNGLGALAADTDDYKTARKNYEQALSIYRHVYGDTHPDVASAEINLANAEAALGDWAAAADSMHEARRTARRYVARVLIGLAEKDQLAFLHTTDNWRLYCALSLGLAKGSNPRLAEASAECLANSKAVAEEALSERARLAREATSPATAKIVRELIAVRGRLAMLSLQAGSGDDRTARQTELAELAAQEEALSRQLGGLGADARTADPWVSLDDLRRKLPADALLIDLARVPLRNFAARDKESVWQSPHYVAWLIPPTDKGDIRIVDLGLAEPIETAVQKARRAISGGRSDGGLKGLKFAEGRAADGANWQASLAALSALVWKPLEPQLRGFREAIVSPDAALWLIPWSALPSGDGQHFALENWQIRYVTSARDLVLAGGATASQDAAPAVFADPDYDLGPRTALAETAAILDGLAKQPSGRPLIIDPAIQLGSATRNDLIQLPASLRTAGPHGSTPRLPGTAQEAAAIRPALAKYAGSDPEIYLDRQALEGVAKRLKHPRVLALSTHGYFLADQYARQAGHEMADDDRSAAALDSSGQPIENPLLRCGLLLAGCNHRNELAAAGVDDGVLTGLEIVGCDLRGTELVVLSACDTGLGDIHNGEGVAGLRQAFQLAGARAVVASLWQVPDVETSQLMSQFFANLAQGQSKAEALRRAQLSMIQSSRRHGADANPFYWAAFTLTGQ
jgi:tetratricopeptide (TPR) repeat protein